MPTFLRVALHGAALAVGVVAGVVGSFVHPARVAGLPVGLLCALGLSAAGFVAGGLAVGARSGAAAGALGWLVPVLLLSSPRPEGDLVVAGDGFGYAWLLGGTVVAAVAVALPYPLYVARAASSGRTAPGR